MRAAERRLARPTHLLESRQLEVGDEDVEVMVIEKTERLDGVRRLADRMSRTASISAVDSRMSG